MFERSQALEDLETEAVDNAHFMYRVCTLSGIIDRFDFDEGNGSLNGLRTWLQAEVGQDAGSELTEAFQIVQRLRKQYPIHEQFSVDTAGELHHRADVVKAEHYFDLVARPQEDWRRVLARFVDSIERLTETLTSATRPN